MLFFVGIMSSNKGEKTITAHKEPIIDSLKKCFELLELTSRSFSMVIKLLPTDLQTVVSYSCFKA